MEMWQLFGGRQFHRKNDRNNVSDVAKHLINGKVMTLRFRALLILRNEESVNIKTMQHPR